MDTQFFRPRWQRIVLGLCLLGLLGLRGSEGLAQTNTLRIGLQTRQTEVHLQTNTTARVQAPGADPLNFPPETTLIFRAQNGGGSLVDANGVQLLAFTAPVEVLPQPMDPDKAAAPLLIRLLGPTRHYDGKPDRPYRGAMQIIPRADGLTVINEVNIEDYLLGVVSSEMSPGYPLEALKAQAVAARTYALKNLGRLGALGFDLDDTAACQVYGGYFSEDPRTTRAVTETASQVMIYNGQLIDAVYSSTCGGYTESAEEAWGRKVPYLVSVPDFGDNIDPVIANHPQDEAGWSTYFKTARGLNCLQPKYARPEAFRWVKLITRKELEAALPAGDQVGTIKNIVVLHRGASGRITALRLDGSDRSVEIDQELPIRKAFGSLRSSAFSVDSYQDDNGVPVVFAFWGAGWGHGLGMCQVGAVGLADQGWSYDKILTHYYPGITIGKP